MAEIPAANVIRAMAEEMARRAPLLDGEQVVALIAVTDRHGERHRHTVHPNASMISERDKMACGAGEALYVDDRFHADGSRCRHR